MSKLSRFATASVLSVVVAGSMTSTAFAWHPKGTITKSVQNMTSTGALSAADTPATAVSVKQGDILNYVIEVKNVAAPADKQYNDMAFTVVTDTLPAGVELVSNPSTRTLKHDMGLILPGQSKKVEYQVKVTSTTNNGVVTNKACFTADSVVKDNPQKGCDDAVVKVTVPVTPQAPEQTKPVQPAPAPQTPATPAPAQPQTLPAAGAGVLAPLFAVFATVGGYIVSMKRRLTK
ncbi:MAG: hypothetical protein JWP13_479 [Candidatus Saccharibacteria bacterium]|nr:hypothetical protein [Candidatus Saccharibacteria bacterium]